MPYTDFSVTIKSEESLEIKYALKGENPLIAGRLAFDAVTRLSIERLNAWVNFGLKQQEDSERTGKSINPVTIDDLKVIGLNLHHILFTDERIQKGFNDVYKQFEADAARDPDRRLRVRLVFGKGAESVSRLPWEFLFIPGDPKPLQGFFFAGQRTELILTRHVPSENVLPLMDGPAKIESEKLRILVALSTPKGEGNIDTQELRTLLDQIKQMPIRPQLEYLEGEQCTTDEFTAKLTAFKPHIVHFIGHGKEGQLAFIKKITDDDYDEHVQGTQARWVLAEQLGGMIANCRPRPRLVFLHACKGAASTSNDTFNSCARELVYAQVPAVVAMQYNISNRDAALFAKTFYEALGLGSDLDEAVKAGRLALGNAYPMWAHPRFATPVVYLQSDQPIVRRIQEQPGKSAGQDGAAASASRIASAGALAGGRSSSETAATPAAKRGPGRTYFEG
jgi:hypothetical protein